MALKMAKKQTTEAARAHNENEAKKEERMRT